jgi:flagellar basal-body rod protein FlgF
MDRGTYASAAAGAVQVAKLDIVNNNLANANTPGFKRQFLVREVQSFEDTLAGRMQSPLPFARDDHERVPGVQNISSVTDFSLGSIKQTGNPLDVALSDPHQFFMVQTDQGVQYSRAGNFTLDGNNQLVTQDGLPVIGDGGPITVEGVDIFISPAGTITASGQEVGRLGIARFDDPQALERVEATRFRLKEGGAAPETVDQPHLIVSSLEMSNVSTIESVIDLITVNRAFDLYTKAARSIDELNQAAITQVGKRT